MDKSATDNLGGRISSAQTLCKDILYKAPGLCIM